LLQVEALASPDEQSLCNSADEYCITPTKSQCSLLLLQSSSDLFRGPFLGQSGTDDLVDYGIFHLPHQGPLLPSPLGLALGLCGIVPAALAVAAQLAADRRRGREHCDFVGVMQYSSAELQRLCSSGLASASTCNR